ncbi:hypothetical protein JG688_00000993 [Phytophthora aleatoria]|uniref:Phospholipase D-like domain-containing protein n=1 Tax=Phytophthora aleatoria TaxID=2496075 RepID=A0A8J5IY79_9STRA|nr:hypothetical protein JG688_00000993 [Phytophthora aleatoria]
MLTAVEVLDEAHRLENELQSDKLLESDALLTTEDENCDAETEVCTRLSQTRRRMWYELSNKHIAKELVDAKRRGLDVKICLGKSMLYAAADALQEHVGADVEVRVAEVGRKLHVNVALLDEVVMLNMSAFEKNIEDIVFFRSLEVARVYTNIFAAVG